MAGYFTRLKSRTAGDGMVRVRDIQAINDRAAAEIAWGETPTGGYYGFIDIDYLDCRPFVMFHANDCDVCER
jgi:hypothetical protein